MCEFSTKCRSYVKQHIKAVHNKEKPFKCEVCQTCFGEKVNLNRHQRTIHENDKPFKCGICQKSYGFIELTPT